MSQDPSKEENKVQPEAATPAPPAPKAEKKPDTASPAPVQSEVKKEESGEDRINMSKLEFTDVVRELVKRELAGKESKTDNLLEQILDEQRASGDGPRMVTARSYAEKEIDVDDYLDKPVIIFCYSHSHICMGDKRLGQNVKTPYDTPIRFKHLMRYKKPGTSRHNDEMITMSSAVLRSKKEAKWMKDHTLFNIKYFEDIQDAKSVSRTFSDKMVEISMQLNTMSEFEVIERAKAEQLEITPDVDEIRRRLVYTITEESMQGGIENRTHHKIAAADPTFDHTSDASMEEATKDAKTLDGAPA